MRLTFKKVQQEKFRPTPAMAKAYLDGVEFLTFWRCWGFGGNAYYVIRMQVDRTIEELAKDNFCSWKWVNLPDMFHDLDAAKAFVRERRHELFALFATEKKEAFKK